MSSKSSRPLTFAKKLLGQNCQGQNPAFKKRIAKSFRPCHRANQRLGIIKAVSIGF